MIIAHSLKEFQQLPDSERRDTYLPEELATAYPIIECSDSLVVIETLLSKKDSRLLLSPIAPGFGTKDLRLRKGALERLLRAATILPSGVNIKIVEAYRPLNIQRKYFKEVEENIRMQEGLEGRALWNRVTQFVADPELCPPHTTGGAVDCTLVDRDGIEVNMGSPLNDVNDLSYTFAEDISEEARKNRMTLYNALVESGFVNLPTEWWHFSFGDQYWAAYKGAATAIYGSLDI